jgi:Tfp pilus assembly protein PilX
MARFTCNQRGVAAQVVLVAFILLAVIGFAGYKVATLSHGTNDAATAANAPVDEPEKIQSKADLTSTSKALDDSSNELDSSMDDSTLDADLNSML